MPSGSGIAGAAGAAELDEARAGEAALAHAPYKPAAETGRLVATNTLAQLVAHGVVLVAAVGTNAMLSRSLGPEGFGRYALVFAYVGLIAYIFADWGLIQIAARDASQRPADTEAILASAAVLQLLAATLAYAVLLIAAYVLVGGWMEAGVAIAGLTLLFIPLDVLATVLQVQLKLTRAALVGIAGSVTRLVLTAGAVALGAGLTGLVAVTALATAARYAYLVPTLHGCLRWRRLRPEARRYRPLLLETWPLALATTCMSLMNQLPIVVLGKLSSAEQVGYFSAAARVTFHVSLVPYMLAVTMYPLFSRLAVDDRASLAQLVGRTSRYMVLLAIPLSLVGFVVGSWLMGFIYGAPFAPAGPMFGVLMVQAAVLYPQTIAAQTLIALGRQRTNLVVLAIGSVVVTAVCLVLARPFGGAGAAIALLAGTIVVAVCMEVALRRHLGASSTRWRRLTLAGLAIAGTTALVSTVAPPLIALGCGVAIYGMALAAVGGIDRGDAQALSSLLWPRRLAQQV